MGRLTSSVDLVTGLQTKPLQAKTPIKPKSDLVGTPTSDLRNALDTTTPAVTHETSNAVTHKVTNVTHRTNAQRQKDYRERHPTEYKTRNAQRMKAKRSIQ